MKDLFDKTFFKLFLGFAAIILISLAILAFSARYNNTIDNQSQFAKPANVVK